RDVETGEIIRIPKSCGAKEAYSSEGERKVKKAYPSNKDGSFMNKGSFITLELEVDPRISIGSTIAFNGSFNVPVDCEYTIFQVKPLKYGETILKDMIFNELDYKKTLLADKFNTYNFNHEAIPLTYAA